LFDFLSSWFLFLLFVYLFFFSSRRRHTRCYRDWSSDVCSSDLDERDLELGEEGLGHAGADDERLVGAERGERADQEDEEPLGEVIADAEGEPERQERADDAPAQLLQVRGEGHAHIVLWPHAAGHGRVRRCPTPASRGRPGSRPGSRSASHRGPAPAWPGASAALPRASPGPGTRRSRRRSGGGT